MKKVLTIILAIVLACSSFALVACNANLVSIKFKEGSVPASVEFNEQIDYSKLIILAEYDNGKTTELPLNSKGVAFTAIDTSTSGSKTLTVTFGGKSVQTVIEVKSKTLTDTVTLSFKQGTVPTSVEVGTEIDYSKIILVVEHTVGDDQEIALSQPLDGMTVNKIDTATTGTKTLSVTYLGKTAQAAIIVSEPVDPDEDKIEFKQGTVPTSVDFEAEIDYSTIILVITFANGGTQEVPLSQPLDGMVVTRIDTSTSGTKTLTVTYLGKTAQAAIVVNEKVEEPKVQITAFLNSKGYLAYEDAKGDKINKDTQFVIQTNAYEVGVDNGYRLIPQVEGVDVNGDDFDSLEQVKTTYALYVKNSGGGYEKVADDQIGNYIEKVQNNVYYFTKQAAGEQLKIEVTLSPDYELIDESMPTMISQEIKLVNGYNVYDAIGLSVLDNLNIKSWANIKNTKLPWDDGKKLSEFTEVEQVVIHDNITITVNDLPSNYFWQEGEEAVAGGDGLSYAAAYADTVEKLQKYFEGSLKESYLGEAWEQGTGKRQRGLYMTNGIGISGNYLTLSYKSGLDASGEPTGKGLYTVWDWNARKNPNPESHYGFVSYRYYEGATPEPTGNCTVSNVYFVGQTQKTNNVDLPTAMMMVTGNAERINVVNTIGTQWYINGVYDGRKTVVTFDSCKLFESFNQMVMTIRIKELNFNNCEMRNAGGPMLVIQTQSGTDPTIEDFSIPTVVNINAASKLENWVTPSANWFAANGIPETIATQLLSYVDLADANVQSKFVKTEEGGVKYYNLWGVMIPGPSYVFNNVNKLEGTVNIGDGANAQNYGMDNDVFQALINLSENAGKGKEVIDQILAMMPNDANLTKLSAGFGQLQSATNALRIAPIFKSGNVYATTTTGKNFIDVVAQVQTNVETLSNGVLAVKEQISAMDEATLPAAQKTALEQALQNVAYSLKPIVDADTLTSEKWSAGWKTEHVMSFWINPAAASETPNPNSPVKHFMVLLGENTSAENQ